MDHHHTHYEHHHEEPMTQEEAVRSLLVLGQKALDANDSVRIASGTYDLTSGTDSIRLPS